MTDIEDRSGRNTGSSNTSDKVIINSGESNRNKVAFVLKLIVIITGAIYLLCQAIQLLKLYNEYNTSVSVHYEYSDRNQFPSFTICLPAIVDRQKLIQKYPNLETKLNGTIDEDKRKNILTEYLDESFDSMIWKELSITEEENFNCSINYWPSKFLESNDYNINRSVSINCRDVVKPIESFINNKGKCFTYFSQLESEENFIGEFSLKDGVKNLNDINEIISIDFKLDFHKYLTLGHIENYTTLAIHHQKMIPNMETRTQLISSEHKYDITINKISSKLLPKPYKTMCRYYNTQNNGLMSREDCIDNCVVELYRSKCKCRPYYLTNAIQLLNSSTQTVCSRQDMRIMSNPCYKEIAKEVSLCQTLDRCPHECESIQYNFQTVSRELEPEMMEMNRLLYENRVIIKFRFDHSIGNTIVKHVPLMTCGQLFCYICSLIAVFSGLSLIGCTNFMIDKILSVQLTAKRQVSDEKISTISVNQEIKQKDKWKIKKKESKKDCLSSCIGSPRRQRIPLRKTTTSLYNSNIVDVITSEK